MGEKEVDDVNDYGLHFKENEAYKIGAEVVRRQRKVTKQEQKQEREEFVSLDWDDIFPKKPKDKLKWLDKALRGCQGGRVKAGLLFNIVVHKKFLEGLEGHIASDCLNLLRTYMDVFTHKQKKQLQSDGYELWRKFAPCAILDSSDEEAGVVPDLPPPAKVIIDKKEKQKLKDEKEKAERIAAAAAAREMDGELSVEESEEENEYRKRRKLAGGVERRIDPADGQAYTLTEFIEQYGGSDNRPPVEWDNSRHTSFFFKS